MKWKTTIIFGGNGRRPQFVGKYKTTLIFRRWNHLHKRHCPCTTGRLVSLEMFHHLLHGYLIFSLSNGRQSCYFVNGRLIASHFQIFSSRLLLLWNNVFNEWYPKMFFKRKLHWIMIKTNTSVLSSCCIVFFIEHTLFQTVQTERYMTYKI